MNQRILTVLFVSVFLCVVLVCVAFAAVSLTKSEKKGRDALVAKYCTSADMSYTTIAYGEQKDDILKQTYTFLIFQEVDKTDESAWAVRVVSNFLTGSRINPDNQKMLEDKAGGKDYVTFGSPFVAPKGDKRVIEYRYYPAKKLVEVYAVLRDKKGKAKPPVIIQANPPVWK